MPLYNQATNLQGRGNFAPGVTYYAGIKAPDQPHLHLPKQNASFNIDLTQLGNAMIQASRDKKETELGLAKLNYAKQEKAEEAALKQLKIDTSNALAQEISNVTEELNQGFINPLTASRKQKEIKDRYRALGILDASAIASTASAEDGGASTFLQNRREQYGKFETKEITDRLDRVHKAVESSRNMSNAEALNLDYQIQQAGVRAAAAVQNLNNGSGTQELETLNYQTLMNEGMDAAVYQATSTLGNIVSTSPNMSPSQMVQNAYENTYKMFKGFGASDEVSLAAANAAMEKVKPYTDLIQNGTKEEKEYFENKALSGKYQRLVMLHQMYPIEAMAAENVNIDFSKFGVKYNTGLDGKQGSVILPWTEQQTVAAYSQVGQNYVSQQVPVAYTFPNGMTIPFNNESAYVANHPREYLMSIMSGKMPVGSYIGRPIAMGLTATAAYNPNMNLSGSEVVNKNSQELTTAISNSKAFYNSVNSATGRDNLKRQGEYDGIDYQRIHDSYNTADGVEVWKNDPKLWNKVYKDYGAPIQDSEFLYDSLRIAPDGSLMMTPIKGKLNTLVDVINGEDFKENVRNLNEATLGFDPKTRASLTRALVNKNGKGILDADPAVDISLSNDPTVGERVGDTLKETFKWVNKKVVNEQIVPLEEKVVKQLEDDVATPVLQWAEDKGISIANTYSKWLEDNNLQDGIVSRYEFLKQSSAMYIKDLIDTYDRKFANKPVETELTLPEPNVGGLQDIVQSLRSSDVDFQLGSIDFRDPNALPIVIEDDGKSWASIKFGTIGADGRTYIVPSLTEDGKPSTVKKEFDKGRTLGSVAGEDERAINNAEYMGQKIRQYLIDRDEEKAQAKMATAQQQDFFTDSSFSKETDINYRNIDNAIKEHSTITDKAVKEIKTIENNLSEKDKRLIEELNQVLKKQWTDVEDAFKAGYTGDKADVDKFVKDYNEFGEKYGYVAQTLWLAKQFVPMLGGSMLQVAEGSSEEVGKWVYAILQIPGVNLETLDERTKRYIEEYISANKEMYESRYGWRRFFTPGLFEGDFEPLEYRTNE